jgi:hypothetical protein
MTRDELFAFHKQMTRDAFDIMVVKNSDYGAPEEAGGDPFANFRADGLYGFVVRMGDKLSRLRTFTQRGSLKVQDESATDSLRDLLNYAVLMAAYIEEQKRSRGGPQITAYLSVDGDSASKVWDMGTTLPAPSSLIPYRDEDAA